MYVCKKNGYTQTKQMQNKTLNTWLIHRVYGRYDNMTYDNGQTLHGVVVDR